MEPQAVAKGDLRFLPLASLEAEIEHLGKLTTRVALKGFAIPNTELIPQDARRRAMQWTDYIDYWVVDWDCKTILSPRAGRHIARARRKSCRSSLACTRTKNRPSTASSYA